MSEHIRTGFVRARRFLIAVSLALACFNVLGLTFSQVSIFGNTATIKHPEHVNILIWVAWMWAVVQYAVWFRDVGASKEFLEAITGDCIQRLGNKASMEPVPEWLQNQLAAELKNRLPKTSHADIHYIVKSIGINGDGRKIDRALQMTGEAHTRLPNDYLETAGPIRFERPISRREWRGHIVTAVALVLLTRRFFLEYFAPFVIAVLPFAVVS